MKLGNLAKAALAIVFSATLAAPCMAQVKPHVAVLDLEASDEDAEEAAYAFSDELRQAFLDSHRYILVDRANIEKIMDEWVLQQSGAVDPAQTVRVGKMYAVQQLVTGRVLQFQTNQWQVSATVVDTESAETLRVKTDRYAGPFFDFLNVRAPTLARIIAGTEGPEAVTSKPASPQIAEIPAKPVPGPVVAAAPALPPSLAPIPPPVVENPPNSRLPAQVAKSDPPSARLPTETKAEPSSSGKDGPAAPPPAVADAGRPATASEADADRAIPSSDGLAVAILPALFQGNAKSVQHRKQVGDANTFAAVRRAVSRVTLVKRYDIDPALVERAWSGFFGKTPNADFARTAAKDLHADALIAYSSQIAKNNKSLSVYLIDARTSRTYSANRPFEPGKFGRALARAMEECVASAMKDGAFAAYRKE